MSPRRAGRVALTGIAALAFAGLTVALIGRSVGLFSGSRPAALGFSDGRFADREGRPNWVSSTVPREDAKHYIAPIAFSGDAGHAWARLAAVLAAMPRVTIVTRSPVYLHAEFASEGLRFVDDTEFALDAAARVIHVKSGARLGVRDFGVNRKRIEAIRASFAVSLGLLPDPTAR